MPSPHKFSNLRSPLARLLAPACFFLLCLVGQAQAGLSFFATPSYGAGTDPQSVAVGDFNGDGKADLAVVNAGSNTVSILLANGDGTFAAAVNYGAGTNPKFVAVGDFNGDGKADLVVASGSGVFVLLGNGNGTFAAAVNSAAANPGAGNSAQSVAVGDFNGDGKADLVVTTGGSRSVVSVLLSNGNGTFSAAATYDFGDDLVFAAVGDFNGDGKADLAIGSDRAVGIPPSYITQYSTNVAILLGHGDGTFAAAVNYSEIDFVIPTFRGCYVVVGDFNGDGKADLAVVSRGLIAIRLGNGDGTFSAAVTSAAVFNSAGYSSAQSIAVGDLNRDGKADLVVTSAGLSTFNIFILLGHGDGTFSPAVSFGAGNAPKSVAIADFNGDGKADVAVANFDGISILFGNGGGSFGGPPSYSVGTNPKSVAVGDFNGDGNADLAVVNADSNNVSILLGNGTGSFSPAVNYAAGNSPQSVAVGDFNGDGKADLVVVNAGSNNVSILLGNGTGSFSPAVNYGAGNSPQSVAVGDFNGDGKADLAVVNNFGVSILLGNGNGTFAAAVNYGAGSGGGYVAVGDFNGDGKPDLVVANGSGVFILLGQGNGTFVAAVNYGAATGPVAVGDFNGDGKADLAMANSNGVSILIGHGDGTFAAAVNYSAGSGGGLPGTINYSSIAIADFNGDGKADVAVVNGYIRLSNAGGTFSVLLGNGDGTFSAAVNFGAGSLPIAVAVGDFNRDGKADVAVVNGTWFGNVSNTVSILLNTSTSGSTNLTGTVVEFYNSILDNYFITANSTEGAAIDSGSAGPGWMRTDNNFKSGGSTPVCRFYGSVSPGPNSHFYTVFASECETLIQLQASTPATQKRWNFESLDFLSTVPLIPSTGGNLYCPSGTVPVYRAYNNGSIRGVDSNHRITSSLTAIQQVVARGWISEGTVMCAPQ